ncbi:hypothetical protein LPB41_06585 [Thalassospira sp. MA62]|nr:hypothetical protein [Thalassospira sp. MA62]
MVFTRKKAAAHFPDTAIVLQRGLAMGIGMCRVSDKGGRFVLFWSRVVLHAQIAIGHGWAA